MFHKFYVINCVVYICWFAPSFPVRLIPKSRMQFASSHCILASGVGFVIGVVFRLRTRSRIVSFSYLVPARVAVGVRVAPVRPQCFGGIVVVVVVVVPSAAAAGVAVGVIVVAVVVAVAVELVC